MPLHTLDEFRPTVPPEGRYWIAPDARVIGQVSLGNEVGIWFGAVLRGDNAPITLGARCNVQEHAVLHVDPGHPVVVGDDVTIGHRALVHGCTIGANSLVGMAAVILTGARIGANSLVGAGALITEGKSFPDGSLIVGSPARIARALKPEEIEKITLSAATYVANWRRFAAGLRTPGGS